MIESKGQLQRVAGSARMLRECQMTCCERDFFGHGSRRRSAMAPDRNQPIFDGFLKVRSKVFEDFRAPR
jgi:hypothetical protein